MLPLRQTASPCARAQLGATPWSPVAAACTAAFPLDGLRHRHCNFLGLKGVNALGANAFPNLETLSISGCELNDDTMMPLVAATGMPRLATLRARRNRLTDVGATSLATCGWLRDQLASLYLDYNDEMRQGPELLRNAFGAALKD
jgi:hypothetical protein